MSESINYFYFLFCLLFTCFGKLNAQQIPYLERTVTLHATNQALNEVFNDINSQTGAVFSYTKTVDDRRKVNINCQKKPLRLVLNELLKGTYCTYKIKDKYIIVKCETQPVSPPSLITGYIYSITDSSIIPQASIYVKQTKNSAVSNNYGFFSLSYSNKLPNITVSFAKEDYKDTSLVIYNQDKQEVLIYLYPKTTVTEIDEDITMQTQQPVAIKDSVLSAKQDSIQLHKNFINKLLENSKKIRFNLRNISDTLFSKFSVSLTPYISTNRLLSVNTVNKYAFNIFGGYSLGTEAFELGGIFNIDKGNANGVQLAGVFNLVGDSVTGAQIGGLFNVTGKRVTGFQGSGLFNLNMNEKEGVQIAGCININGKKNVGVSIGGIANISDTVQGAVLAGLFNSSIHSIKSMEMACFANRAVYGKNNFQLSGVFNSTRKGTTNSQLSIFYNRAHTLKGIQLGFVNYADSARGVPIGFLSIVKKGYHKIELASDELMFGSVAFCTGVPRLYNIFLLGMNYNKTNFWTYGYGFGSDIAFKNKFGVTFAATTQQIKDNNTSKLEWNLLNKIGVGLTYKIVPKIRVDLGPTFNLFIADALGNGNVSSFDQLSSFQLQNPNLDSPYIRMFIGAKLALKFF